MNHTSLEQLVSIILNGVVNKSVLINDLLYSLHDQNHRTGILENINQYSNDEYNSVSNPWVDTYYSPVLNVVYLPIPKNATNSIAMFLLALEYPELYGFLDGLVKRNSFFAQGVFDIILKSRPVWPLDELAKPSLNIVTFVRDPIKRFISAINDKLVWSHFLPPNIDNLGTFSFIEAKIKHYMGASESLTLNNIIKYMQYTPHREIERHFAPQYVFVNSLKCVSVYNLSDAELVLNALTNPSAYKKLANLNTYNQSAGIGNQSCEDILDKPFVTWNDQDKSLWNNSFDWYGKYAGKSLNKTFVLDYNLIN